MRGEDIYVYEASRGDGKTGFIVEFQARGTQTKSFRNIEKAAAYAEKVQRRRDRRKQKVWRTGRLRQVL